MTQTVFVAGATGYLGQHLVAIFKQRNWKVIALARSAEKADAALAKPDKWVIAEATQSCALEGIFAGVDVVVSSLGVTRQKDGLRPWNVDYQANMNLLDEAVKTGVSHFAYVHVLNARRMLNVPLVSAKQAFVDKLLGASIGHTIVEPSGYFSDMADFLAMAKTGRVWLFGDGQTRLNPIHGEDLAEAIEQAVSLGQDAIQIGGPDILTHKAVAEMAFEALGETPKITCLPYSFRRVALKLLRMFTPQRVADPIMFFLTAVGFDMVGDRSGRRRLADFFSETMAGGGRK